MAFTSRSARATALLVGMTLLTVPAGRTAAHESQAQPQAYSIEGNWNVLVTLTNCATGDPLPIPQFYSLVTFGPGGLIAESTGSLAFAPNQRSEGHGTWKRLGAQTYSQHTLALVRFANNPQTTPPVVAGWQTIDQTVTLTGRDAFTSSGTTDFYDINGAAYRHGCATAAAERLR